MEDKKRIPFSFAKKMDDLDRLSSKRLAKYEDSLEALKLMRRGNISLTKAAKTVHVSPATVKRNVGNALEKKNKRIIPKKNDNLLRKMRIYENGREVWIQVRGKTKAAKIGKYHGAVGKLLEGQSDAIQTFENKSIKDTKGKTHRFETDSKKLQDIAERREEPEFFTLYSGGRQ